jgi:hypothetical protein
MATISRTGITGGGTIQPTHITNIIDALDGTSTTTTVVATGSFTGSLRGELTGTASFATLAQTANTASYVVTAQTASYVVTAQTASYVLNAVSASYAANVPATASYALTALSSSYAVTASYALNGGSGGSGIFVLTGSVYATTNTLQVTGSMIVTAGVTASLQGTASYTTTARQTEVARTAADAAYYPVLVDSANATATAEALKSTTYLTINPSTNTISNATVSGSLNVSSSLSAQSNARIIFNSIGTQGNFCIPIAAPNNPIAGSMYWDDVTNTLYIYSATNAGWYNVGLNP